MFGNMYIEPKYNFDQEMSEIFLTIENRKEFNKKYQCQFTIKKRLNNRMLGKGHIIVNKPEKAAKYDENDDVIIVD